MMSRLKQCFCLLLAAAVLTAGAPAVFADPAEGIEIEDSLLPAEPETADLTVAPAEAETAALADVPEAETAAPTVVPEEQERVQPEVSQAKPAEAVYAAAVVGETAAGALVNENFDSVPTKAEAATRPVPYPHGWSSSEGELVSENSWLVLKHKTGGNKNYQLDMPVMNGVLKENAADATAENTSQNLPQGESYVEFAFRMGQKATQTQIYVSDSDRTNLLKFIFANNQVSLGHFPPDGSGLTAQTTLSGTTNIMESCTVKMLFSSGEGSLSLEQVWVNGAEKLTAPLPLKANADGVMKVAFCPTGGSQGVGEEALAIDWYRVYTSGLSVLEEMLKEEGAKLTFEDIQGENTSSNAVEYDLDFKSKTETDNGLKVMEWRSSEPGVVTAEGKVIRPESNDCKVTLTPVLGMQDTTGESESGYLTADGAPLYIIVKSIQGGAVEQGKIFEYKLNEPFDDPRTDASKQPMPWINGWGDKNNTAEAVVKDGAVWINQTKGVCQNKYQLEIPFTYGYTHSGGGSPLCGTVPRGDLFVDFSWITGPKTTDMTFYLCSRNTGDANTVSWLFTRAQNTDEWKASVRRRKDDKTWQEMTTVEKLKLFDGENNIRVHLDASQSGTTVLKGVWINGQMVPMAEEDLRDIGTGLFKLMMMPTGTQGAGDNVIQLTGMKVWESFEKQLGKLVQQPGEQMSFAGIAGDNTGQNEVTSNLVFQPDQTSPSGNFKIDSWKADRTDLVAADGTVSRPSYEEGDQQVVLTPVFLAEDPENVDGTGFVKADGLPLTITVKAMSVADSVQHVKETLSFEDIKGENTSAASVEKDLNLISVKSGVQLAWELVSINPSGTSADFDSKTGAVTRPEQNQSDVTMTVKARLSCQGVTAESNPITFTVKKLNVATAEYLQAVSDALTFAVIGGVNESESKIRTDLNLPVQFQGAAIAWECSGKEISATGAVTRPGVSESAVSVTLTAQLSYGTSTINKTFHLTIQPEDAENLVKAGKVIASVEGSAEELAYLLDENRNTGLPVKSSVKKFNLVFDLGVSMPVSQASFEEKELEPGVWAVQEYTIDISDNNSSWTTVYQGSTSGLVTIAEFDPVLARYVRLNVTKKENGRACELAETAVRFQPSDSARVSADADYLTIEVPQRITGSTITLPDTGVFGSEISWSFSPAGLISDQFTVTHPDGDASVTLIAEFKSGDARDVKRFQRTVTGSSNGSGGNKRPGGGGGGGGTTPRLPESTESGVQATPAPNQNGGTETFSDLGQAEWARPYIMGLYDKGIVNGKTENAFMPLDNVTREEFVKMLALVFGLETAETDEFSDVESRAWYAPYIGGARAAGIVNGVEDGIFGVGRNITRQDMAVMTWRAAEAAGKTLCEDGTEKEEFTDWTEIAEYAAAAVSALQKAGVFSGDETGAFRPDAYATRAEAAKILYLLPERWNTEIGGY